MIGIIMIKKIINIGIDHIVEIGEYYSVVEYNMDRIIETALGMIRTTEILEEILDQIKITEVDIEEVTEMMKEVGIGLEKDSFQICQKK